MAAQPGDADDKGDNDKGDDDDKGPPKVPTKAELKAEEDRLRKEESLHRQADKWRAKANAMRRPGDPAPNPDPTVRQDDYAKGVTKRLHKLRAEYAMPNGNGTMEANQHLTPNANTAAATLAQQISAETQAVTWSTRKLAEAVQAHQIACAHGQVWPVLPPAELENQIQFRLSQISAEAASECLTMGQIASSEAERLRQAQMVLAAAENASPEEALDMQEGVHVISTAAEATPPVFGLPVGPPPLAPVAPGGAEAAPVAEATSPALALDAAIEAGAEVECYPVAGAPHLTEVHVYEPISSHATSCATDAAPATDDAEHDERSWGHPQTGQPNSSEQHSNASAPNAHAEQWRAPEPTEQQRRPFNAVLNKWICLDSYNDINTISCIRMSTLQCCMHAKCNPMV